MASRPSRAKEIQSAQCCRAWFLISTNCHLFKSMDVIEKTKMFSKRSIINFSCFNLGRMFVLEGMKHGISWTSHNNSLHESRIYHALFVFSFPPFRTNWAKLERRVHHRSVQYHTKMLMQCPSLSAYLSFAQRLLTFFSVSLQHDRRSFQLNFIKCGSDLHIQSKSK